MYNLIHDGNIVAQADECASLEEEAKKYPVTRIDGPCSFQIFTDPEDQPRFRNVKRTVCYGGTAG
jgi:hypothetical protein